MLELQLRGDYIELDKLLKALGLVEADDAAKAKAARTAMLTSRINTLLSIPMLLAMTNFR